MAKTQTKTEIRNNAAKANKLLRGIDNETIALNKDIQKIEARVKNVQQNSKVANSLLAGLSNAALTQTASPKPTAKTAPAKTAPTSKTEKKVATKAAKPSKPVKSIGVTKSAGERPALKKVISEIILKAGHSLPAAEIYGEAVAKHGYWSRQSLYNALKTAEFVKKPDGTFDNATPTTSEDEAESFVKTVEGNTATSAVS